MKLLISLINIVIVVYLHCFMLFNAIIINYISCTAQHISCNYSVTHLLQYFLNNINQDFMIIFQVVKR